jgi:hypothetical protein
MNTFEMLLLRQMLKLTFLSFHPTLMVHSLGKEVPKPIVGHRGSTSSSPHNNPLAFLDNFPHIDRREI